MDLLLFFFDQFKIPILGLLIIGTYIGVRVFLLPVRSTEAQKDTKESE